MEDLTLIRARMGDSVFSQYISGNFHSLLEVEDTVCVGAVFRGVACGAAVAERTETDEYHLRYIYVDPQARFCGLGTYLLRGLLGEVRESGAAQGMRDYVDMDGEDFDGPTALPDFKPNIVQFNQLTDINDLLQGTHKKKCSSTTRGLDTLDDDDDDNEPIMMPVATTHERKKKRKRTHYAPVPEETKSFSPLEEELLALGGATTKHKKDKSKIKDEDLKIDLASDPAPELLAPRKKKRRPSNWDEIV